MAGFAPPERGMPVGMLQAFAVQGRPAGGRADDEASGHLVHRRPQRVAGALETGRGFSLLDVPPVRARGRVVPAAFVGCLDVGSPDSRHRTPESRPPDRARG